MPNNFLGEVRRSQILGYGPGAIIDFRAGGKGGAAVSVIAADLTRWKDTANVSAFTDPHVVYETRLQKKLGTTHFRLPPVDDEGGDSLQRYLEGVRFPTWLQCPKCGRLKAVVEMGKGTRRPVPLVLSLLDEQRKDVCGSHALRDRMRERAYR